MLQKICFKISIQIQRMSWSEYSSHIVAISRKTKVRKAVPNIVYKRSYNKFCGDSYVVDVKNICWSMECNEEQPDAALDTFMKLLIPVTNKQRPLRKWLQKRLNPHGLMRNWKIVCLRWMRQKEWQISLAEQLIGKHPANWEIMWLNWIKRRRNYTMEHR